MLTNETTVYIMSCVVWVISYADKQNQCVHYVLCCMGDIWCRQAKNAVCIVSCVVWMTLGIDKQNH